MSDLLADFRRDFRTFLTIADTIKSYGKAAEAFVSIKANLVSHQQKITKLLQNTDVRHRVHAHADPKQFDDAMEGVTAAAQSNQWTTAATNQLKYLAALEKDLEKENS